MTLPGPIPTGGIPNVTPMYHTQLPGLGETLTPQIQLLQSILQDKQARKEAADKLLLDRIMGNAYRKMIEGVDATTVPSPGNLAFRGTQTQSGIGTDQFGQTAAPAGMPIRVEGEISKSLHDLPGEAVTRLLPYLQGPLAEGARRRGDKYQSELDMVGMEAKYRLERGMPSYKDFVSTKNEFIIVDQNTGYATIAKDPLTNKTIYVRGPVQTGPQPDLTSVIDMQPGPQYGHVVQVNKADIDTNRYALVDLSTKGENMSAYNFITPMVKAYKEIRNSQPDIKDTTNASFLTAVEGALQLNSDGLVVGLAAAKGLNPRTKQWLDGVLRFANARAFAQSGKAVPKAEFLRILKAEFPMLGVDDEQASNVKYDALEAVVGSVNELARPLLAMYHSKEPAWETVRDELRVERAVKGQMGSIQDAVIAEHPDWVVLPVPPPPAKARNEAAVRASLVKISAEAQRRYNQTRPASEARP